MDSSTTGLPVSCNNFFDHRFLISCVPLVGDFQRIVAVVNTFKALQPNFEFTQANIRFTRIDIVKWVIGSIISSIIFTISPIVGIVSVALSFIAIIATIIEQLALYSWIPLAERATQVPNAASPL
jgi:hypothetical protein